MMVRVIARVKHELTAVIPPLLFFFVAFQLLAFTRALILEQYGIQVSTFLASTIAALVVAKVVLVVDLLPFVNRYPHKPLAYNVVWKTLIYMVAALVVRYVEHMIPFVRQYGDLAVAHRHLMEEVVWPHFWVVQIWLLVLFLGYCTMRELVRALGAQRVRELYFGPTASRSG